jgi:hypothetical protein
MDFRKHIENVINRKSKDEDFGIAVITFLEMLKKLDIKFAVMGSYALQTYLPYFHRLPNDFDITLPEESIIKIEQYCQLDDHLTFIQDFVASRVAYANGYCLHLIPDMMNWVDRSSNEIFARFRVYHPDRLEKKSIRFIHFDTSIEVPVHEINFSFCLAITQRLDCNIYSDIIHVLKKYNLEISNILEFLDRVPIIRPLIQHRILELEDRVIQFDPYLLGKVNPIRIEICKS